MAMPKILFSTVFLIFSILLDVGTASHDLARKHIFHNLKSVVETDQRNANVLMRDDKIGAFLGNYNYQNGAAVIKNGAACAKHFFNEADELDLHNFDGDVNFVLENMEILNLEIVDKNGKKFTCGLNTHDEIEKHVRKHVEDSDEPFHQYLVDWNFDVGRTEYHVGNGTHAVVTFVCLPGHQLQVWHDLHLKTHVHVHYNGKLFFHDKMRKCECTPESCAYSVKSYFHSIGAEISNPNLLQNLEKTVCSSSAGASRRGFFELTMDDVKCAHPDEELEDDAVVNSCAVTNAPKCVATVRAVGAGGSHLMFAAVVTLLAALTLIVYFFM